MSHRYTQAKGAEMLLSNLLEMALEASADQPSPSPSPSPSPLQTTKTWVDILAALVTTLALIVGGIWAYYKFIKGRLYRPRIEITIDGEWLKVGGGLVLHVTVAVKNIGSSFVKLLHEGTGLETYPLSSTQPPPPRLTTSWEDGPVLPILTDHYWIEPGETISDDLMLRNLSSDHPIRLDLRLLCKRRSPFKNIVVSARKIVWPPDSGAAAQGDAQTQGKEDKHV